MSAEEQTFVFADLAGFTALTEAHGDEFAADVAARFCSEARTLLPDYDAEEVKSIGDAVMLRVPDPSAAVGLAIRVAEQLGRDHGSLGVRVGMHTGPAVERGGDWFGATVNVAARVAELAQPGEVLMTAATWQAAKASVVDREIRSRGAKRLKNVAEPIELFVVTPPDAKNFPGLPIDPVCRMSVDPSKGAEPIVHRGVTYHFCSDACRDSFAADPMRYVQRRSSRADLRVSDDARERVARRLGRAFTGGRLSDDELDERLARTWAARTRADLEAVVHDLPRRQRPRLRGIASWWRRRRRR